LPSDVRGGVQAFPAVVAFGRDVGAWPAAGACASSVTEIAAATTAASADVETRERWLIGTS
jgi:hypothetical protein